MGIIPRNVVQCSMIEAYEYEDYIDSLNLCNNEFSLNRRLQGLIGEYSSP